jgi:hypothetical protein
VSGGLTELNLGCVFKINDYKSIHDYYSKVIIDNYFLSFLSYILYSLKRTPTKRFMKKNDPKQMKIIQNIEAVTILLFFIGPVLSYAPSHKL